jgi:hypothetical protein
MVASSKVAFSTDAVQSVVWRKTLTIVLAFWLSTSLLLDLVIMPSLAASGMLIQPDFVPAGYGIFWIFNRIELVCAALVVTGLLIQQKVSNSSDRMTQSVRLSLLMLSATLVCTYFVSPQMSSLGVHLNWFETALNVPAEMNQLHGSYWVLEAMKVTIGGILLNWQLDRPSKMH